MVYPQRRQQRKDRWPLCLFFIQHRNCNPPLKPHSSMQWLIFTPPLPHPRASRMVFSCRFYIESISYLKDNATIELFFLNAKSCIYKVGMCSSRSVS